MQQFPVYEVAPEYVERIYSQEKEGISLEQQRLIFVGKRLVEERRPLAD